MRSRGAPGNYGRPGDAPASIDYAIRENESVESLMETADAGIAKLRDEITKRDEAKAAHKKNVSS